MRSNQVEGLLNVVAQQFKDGVKAELLRKLKADIAPQLEEIATAEAARIHEVIVSHWKDQRMMVDWLQYRIFINDKEVPHAVQKADA